jgi:L-fuculose-phosphate aldolase
MSFYASEKNARIMLLKVAKRLADHQYLPANDGNISIRIAQDQFYTLSTGVYKNDIEENMLIRMDISGNVLEAYGCYSPSADTGIHISIFKTFPMTQGVINAQPPYATLRSIQGRPLDEALLPATALHLGTVPVAPYAAQGSEKLSEIVSEYSKGHSALLLQNRGLLVWGTHLFETWQRLETTEQYAQLSYLLEGRDKKLLSESNIAQILQERQRFYLPDNGIPRSKQEVY